MSAPMDLSPGVWYVWQMLPGYGSDVFISPVKVRRVTPLKSGLGHLDLDFYNAFYAEGVREFSKRLDVVARGENYLMASLIEPEIGECRACVILQLTPWWVSTLLPQLEVRQASGTPDALQDSVEKYLLGGP